MSNIKVEFIRNFSEYTVGYEYDRPFNSKKELLNYVMKNYPTLYESLLKGLETISPNAYYFRLFSYKGKFKNSLMIDYEFSLFNGTEFQAYMFIYPNLVVIDPFEIY